MFAFARVLGAVWPKSRKPSHQISIPITSNLDKSRFVLRFVHINGPPSAAAIRMSRRALLPILLFVFLLSSARFAFFFDCLFPLSCFLVSALLFLLSVTCPSGFKLEKRMQKKNGSTNSFLNVWPTASGQPKNPNFLIKRVVRRPY